MRRIIPFAFAIILVLAGGFYLFSSKILISPKVGNVPDQTPQTTGNPGAMNITPTSIPSEKVNQITLSVTSPSNNTTVTSPSVVVKGVTLPGADVSVNEKDVVAGASGAFSATLTLEEGDNYIIVVAVDPDGKVAEQELTVTYAIGE